MNDSRGRLYFDWNSTTPPLAEAIAAMNGAYESAWGNPSSVHAEGRAARARLEEARVAIAELVGASPADVVLTSGGTEASNIALRSPYVNDEKGAILLAPIEHASIMAVATRLGELGVEVRRAHVLPTGAIDLEDVEKQLARGGVRLVAIQAVNGETGVIQPIAEVAEIARRHGACVHVDAIQGIGRVETPKGGWLAHADTVSVASHKIRGPKGIGALVTRAGHPLRPVLRGGSQERGLRPGTQDAALASGFGVAARHARNSVPQYAAVAKLRDRFEAGLEALEVGVAINGKGAARVPHVVHASFRDWSSAELVAAFDLEGLASSGGAACHAGVPEPSATLVAMWREHPAEHWRLEGTVRFSLPPWTTESDVDRALAVVKRVVARGAASLFGASNSVA
ncbi:MAG: cysteine desulfurase family protein [Polyangiales bacterium]